MAKEEESLGQRLCMFPLIKEPSWVILSKSQIPCLVKVDVPR